MIYLTGSNLGVGLHVIDIHGILCEYDSLSGVGIRHLIHREKFERKLGNMKHILESSFGDFNPSFVGDFDRRVVPHQNRRTFTCIQIGIYLFWGIHVMWFSRIYDPSIERGFDGNQGMTRIAFLGIMIFWLLLLGTLGDTISKVVSLKYLNH